MGTAEADEGDYVVALLDMEKKVGVVVLCKFMIICHYFCHYSAAGNLKTYKEIKRQCEEKLIQRGCGSKYPLVIVTMKYRLCHR